MSGYRGRDPLAVPKFSLTLPEACVENTCAAGSASRGSFNNGETSIATRFFFDVNMASRRVRDEVGCMFPDVGAAITAALVDGRKILDALGCRCRSLEGMVFEIRDPTGAIVAHVPFEI